MPEEEGWLSVKWDSEKTVFVIKTPKGDFTMTPKDFSVFCQKGLSLACWAKNEQSIKKFIEDLVAKKGARCRR